jgi:predicted DNA-binding protein with PD1-like motif
MRRVAASAILLLSLAFGVRAQEAAADAAELGRLLNEFLAGAGRNDAGVHERFWADDLIYTGSTGRRVGKADIMRDVRSAPAPKPDDPKTTYTAEDVRIRQYGSTAVVAFRLVGATEKDGRTQVSKFLNTGTFLKRGGKWQAVSWQATKLPPSEEDARKEADDDGKKSVAVERGESDGMRVYALRLRPGQDLRRELESFTREQGIRAGFIITTVGSLRKAAIRLADKSDATSFEGKFEIVSLVGTLARDGVHLHVSLSDDTGRTIGGHLVEGCLIYTTAEIIVGEATGVAFGRETDKLTGYKELTIRPRARRRK